MAHIALCRGRPRRKQAGGSSAVLGTIRLLSYMAFHRCSLNYHVGAELCAATRAAVGAVHVLIRS